MSVVTPEKRTFSMAVLRRRPSRNQDILASPRPHESATLMGSKSTIPTATRNGIYSNRSSALVLAMGSGVRSAGKSGFHEMNGFNLARSREVEFLWIDPVDFSRTRLLHVVGPDHINADVAVVHVHFTGREGGPGLPAECRPALAAKTHDRLAGPGVYLDGRRTTRQKPSMQAGRRSEDFLFSFFCFPFCSAFIYVSQ